ncbi:MAG TPA: hypothetical protein PLR32_02885 [candidate division Zixibacteria bacterium]|nr:hypothetical protein [candidate division Zixibacteria bacterium]MDD4916465.1 hypothetical protein [candidate division Zixibacteria bacterium]MDM7971862.1 hypothetical protein [candidate division Zixibacteria bacterium]HOD65110.1 hypothetical protein [candidate division Zixibacteria bacterium]HPI32234.1 hypothetical protein [candidate division Zixibacteria bacterium]
MDDCNFIDKVDLELKRAERYSVFVSLVVFDLSFLENHLGPGASSVVHSLSQEARRNVREIDVVSVMDGCKLVLLLPETPRQGAEIASRRVSEILRDRLSRDNSAAAEKIIPLEMASYPDAAGARTIRDFLGDYLDRHRN